MKISDQVLIRIFLPDGSEKFHYPGRILKIDKHTILLEAFFQAERVISDLNIHKGDRFIELYFSDRFYNILEIHDRMDDHLKGWYCNLSRPAVFAADQISFVDLALDLLALPDGKLIWLDEDEYNVLPLSNQERTRAEEAKKELAGLFKDPARFQIFQVK